MADRSVSSSKQVGRRGGHEPADLPLTCLGPRENGFLGYRLIL